MPAGWYIVPTFVKASSVVLSVEMQNYLYRMVMCFTTCNGCCVWCYLTALSQTASSCWYKTWS